MAVKESMREEDAANVGFRKEVVLNKNTGDGRKKLFNTEFMVSHEDTQKDEKQERDLVEAKSNEIVEGLLWRYY